VGSSIAQQSKLTEIRNKTAIRQRQHIAIAGWIVPFNGDGLAYYAALSAYIHLAFNQTFAVSA
jgi:hypothetical protein